MSLKNNYLLSAATRPIDGNQKMKKIKQNKQKSSPC